MVPTFVIALPPVASSLVANDGTLYINNLGQRWRSVTNLTTYNSAKDCIWENARCTPQP